MVFREQAIGHQLVLGGELQIDAAHTKALLAIIEHAPHLRGAGSTLLSGRAPVHRAELDGIGSVVVKHYRRGGMFSKFISERYLRSGPTRSQAEFELLRRVRSIGVNCPEPLAYVYKGGLFYKAWLITKEIENAHSLVSIALETPARLPETMQLVSEQICKLIENKLFHTDLHPGNVLVTKDNRAFILDFDKACEFKGSKNALRDQYLCRWRRAVIKHSLPEQLSGLLALGIRKNFID